MAGGAGAAGGPLAEFGDGFEHGSGKGNCLAQSAKEMILVQGLLVVERFIEGAVDGFLDFGAAEAFAGGGEFLEGKFLGVSTAASQMDGEDFLALVQAGEVDKEDFVEAAFAEEFGRERGNVVGGGDDKNRRGFFAEPGEEGA